MKHFEDYHRPGNSYTQTVNSLGSSYQMYSKDIVADVDPFGQNSDEDASNTTSTVAPFSLLCSKVKSRTCGFI